MPELESPIGNLSGGNKQKVVLAKWLESGAEVLIFDEPTHGIDVGAKEEVYRLMVDLAVAGKGVVFISSEFPELVGVCNRVVVMREGRTRGRVRGSRGERVGPRRELLRSVRKPSQRLTPLDRRQHSGDARASNP